MSQWILLIRSLQKDLSLQCISSQMNEMGIYTLYSNDKKTVFLQQMTKCFCCCETVKYSHSCSPDTGQTLLSRSLRAFLTRKNRVVVVLLERRNPFAALTEVEESLTQYLVDLKYFSKYRCVSFNSYISSVGNMHSRCFSNDTQGDVANNSLEARIYFETAIGTYKGLIPSFRRHNRWNG